MRDGLTLFELVVTLTIIGIFSGILALFIHEAAVIAKETTLRSELYDLRLSLVLYKAIKKRNPDDLKELMEARYGHTGSGEVLFAEKFLNVVGIDAEGYPVDPFGNRFEYNSKYGTVRPLTGGYENW